MNNEAILATAPALEYIQEGKLALNNEHGFWPISVENNIRQLLNVVYRETAIKTFILSWSTNLGLNVSSNLFSPRIVFDSFQLWFVFSEIVNFFIGGLTQTHFLMSIYQVIFGMP